MTRRILFIWADFIRGIPLIFVSFWRYFLIPALFSGNLPHALTVGLAIAWLPSAAVMHSTLAGLASLPRGQSKAALSAGLARVQALAFVLLPQALPNILPSLAGQFISLIKDTSLAFIVKVPEPTTVAGQVNNRTRSIPPRSSSSRGRSISCSAARSRLRAIWTAAGARAPPDGGGAAGSRTVDEAEINLQRHASPD